MDNKIFDQYDLAELIRLTYSLDSEGKGVSIENRDRHRFFNINVDSETILIDSETNSLYLPIDNITITVDENGKLVAAGVEEGTAILLEDSEGDGIKKIHVLYNSEQGLGVDSENKLFVKTDSETILINSEGQLFIPIDNITIRINSEGLMVAAGVEAGKAIELIDSEGNGIQTINVRYDSETVFLNSENQLEVRFDKYLDNQAVFNASTFIPRKGLLLTEKDTGFLKVGNGVDTYDKLEYVLIELTKQDIDEIIF